MRWSVPLFLALQACASPVIQQDRSAHAERLPATDGIDYVARLTPTLFRGAQPSAAGHRALGELGIKTVINLREFHSSRAEAEAAGLRYVQLPMRASLGSKPPTDAQLKRFFEIVRDPDQQPVYFHCMTGKDRTGTMAALFRIEHQGWTNAAAVVEMQAFGYHDIFRDLIRFVRDYQRTGAQ